MQAKRKYRYDITNFGLIQSNDWSKFANYLLPVIELGTILILIIMYIHTDVFAKQTSKYAGQACGDAMQVFRDSSATTIVLADGLGSGIKAHIAATMCVSRLISCISSGMPAREAFKSVAQTMDKAWGTDQPFAVFTLLRVLNNGQATVLSYEMPPPLLVTKSYAQILRDQVYAKNKAIIHESSCMIANGDAMVLLSDGITQAGIGKIFPMGWEAEGVRAFIQGRLPVDRLEGQELANQIHDKARSYWPAGKGDDCSVVLALNRRGVIVNLLSGPPKQKAGDEKLVRDFLVHQGIRVIAGGSTAQMAARIMNSSLEIAGNENSITPPAYKIDGVELVTEGMVTLNQVYHLLEEDPENYSQGSPASELAYYLKMADRVNIWQGDAENLGEGKIEFRQQGLLSRKKIIDRLVKRLESQGKLVVQHNQSAS
jgi:hypothetical protein